MVLFKAHHSMSWTSVSHSHSHGHFAHEAKKPQETFWLNKNGLSVGQVHFQKKTSRPMWLCQAVFLNDQRRLNWKIQNFQYQWGVIKCSCCFARLMFLTWVMRRAMLKRHWQIVFSWTQKDVVVTGTFLFAWRQYYLQVEVAFCIPWNQADGDTVISKACW